MYDACGIGTHLARLTCHHLAASARGFDLLAGGYCPARHSEETPLKTRLLSLALFACLFGGTVAPAFADPPEPTPAKADEKKEPVKKADPGDTAWMLASTALVMLMVPGLALFYGGMVRRKNILGTMMHSMVALSVVGIQWVLFGYALAFGDTHN